MNELARVLSAFHDATQCEAGVWMQTAADGAIPSLGASTPNPPTPTRFPPIADGEVLVPATRGHVMIAAVPGPRRAWLALGPCPGEHVDLGSFMSFLLPVVTQYLQSALEVEHAANEL